MKRDITDFWVSVDKDGYPAHNAICWVKLRDERFDTCTWDSLNRWWSDCYEYNFYNENEVDKYIILPEK